MLVTKRLLWFISLVLCITIGVFSLFHSNLFSQDDVPKVEPPRQKSADELIVDLRNGNQEAIPALKEAFERSSDKMQKQDIASALLSYGERDERYLDYLIQHAKAAIESDIPFPFSFDNQGRGIKGSFSPEFTAWAEENKVDPKSAAGTALYQLALDVRFLSEAGDSRAFDTLMKGLESHNYIVVIAAARGLARLQDKRAIKPIIETCRRVPAEAADGIARYLVYFDEPAAQAAAEKFVRSKTALNSVRKRAKEMGVKGIFGH